MKEISINDIQKEKVSKHYLSTLTLIIWIKYFEWKISNSTNYGRINFKGKSKMP